MQRELGRLADRSAKKQQADRTQQFRRLNPGVKENVREVKRPQWRQRAVGQRLLEKGPDEQNAQEHADVANAGDQKRLAGGVRSRGFVEPKANQQIAAHAHAFPEGVEQDQVAGHDQASHRKQKETDDREKARIAFVAAHVPGGVYGDQRAHERDRGQHHQREAVGLDAEPHLEIADGKPFIAGLGDALATHEEHYGQGARPSRGQDARPVTVPPQQRIAQKANRQARQKRQ